MANSEQYSVSPERAFKTFMEFSCDRDTLRQSATTLRQQLNDGSLREQYKGLPADDWAQVVRETEDRIADLEAAALLNTPQFPSSN
jgi:hypothetical protein